MKLRPTPGPASPGNGAADLATRWRTEAADAGWTVDRLDASIDEAAADRAAGGAVDSSQTSSTTVSDQRSSWTRADVMQAICDVQRPVSQTVGTPLGGDASSGPPTTSSPSSSISTRPATPPGVDRMVGRCGSSRPHPATRPRPSSSRRKRSSPGRWRHRPTPRLPVDTVDRDGLDSLQADAAAAVAGDDRLVLVVGPAGAGKTRMLTVAGHDLRRRTVVLCSR